MSSSRTEKDFTDTLRATVVGNIDRRQLAQLCADILATGIKTYSKGDDELVDGIKINTLKDDQGHEVITSEAERPTTESVPLFQAQSLMLDAFRGRLTKTRRFHDLEGWLRQDGQHQISRAEQDSINEEVSRVVWNVPEKSNKYEILLAMEREVDLLVKSEHLDLVFDCRAGGPFSSQPGPDEETISCLEVLMKRGAKHLKEFGDLPAFFKKEKEAMSAAEIRDAGWSMVDATEYSEESLGPSA